MATSPEEQVWIVAEALANASEITALDEMLLIKPEDLKDKLTEIELSKVLNKFAKDHQIIEIVSTPTNLKLDEASGCYEIKIPNQAKFREFLNLAHSKHSGDISRLAGDNFLAICDVAMDICSELQLADTEQVSIPIVPSIIKFSSLLPAKSVGLLDRYGDFRMKALGYMKERGHIMGYWLQNDMTLNRWDRGVHVLVDRFNFDKFYKKLTATYQIRVVEPAKEKEEEEKKNKSREVSIPEKPHVTQIEITKLPELQVRNVVEDNVIQKNKKKISLPKFKATDWNKVVWRFIDDRSVVLGTEDDMKPSDFEALGFRNEKSGKPNLAWIFLFNLSKNNGETATLERPIPDNVKQVKRQVSDFLKQLFKNDTDPFEEVGDGRTYRLKFRIIPPVVQEEKPVYEAREMLG